MLQIRELPEFHGTVPEGNRRNKVEKGNLRRAFFLLGLFIILASSVFLCWAAVKTKPQPRDVSLKQTMFTYNGMTLPQNSTPIPQHEHEILWIRDEDIDAMPPMMMYFYYTTLKDPNFSINFHDNYQELKDKYHIRLSAAGVLLFLGLLSFVSAFFMPKHNAIVEGWSGTEWE
jgi:hypothetical protein